MIIDINLNESAKDACIAFSIALGVIGFFWSLK